MKLHIEESAVPQDKGSGMLGSEIRLVTDQIARTDGAAKTSMRCGYTRCLVHHPGKPLFCPPVSMLRIDTRIQQAVPSARSPMRLPPIVLPALCQIKHVIPPRIINMRCSGGTP